MPLTPPDLSRPYASSADKDADWQLLLRRTESLQELTRLSGVPEAQWPAGEAARLRAVPSISGETAGQRLARWRNVFASEIADLERAVLAASSQGGSATVADIDLRSAVYLAARLLATLYDVAIDQVSP
ncbi:MAG TPA: hypothetical protein VN695_17990 [Streptosporangiaceae bacterium]|nr:hypothetical protein [Streptosporangiaceae bacterium]